MAPGPQYTVQCLCACLHQDCSVFGHGVLRWEGCNCGRAEARRQRGGQLPVDESSASGKSNHCPFFLLQGFTLKNNFFLFTPVLPRHNVWIIKNLFLCLQHHQHCWSCLVSSAGYWQHPPSGPLLSGSGPGQHLTQNTPGWHSHLWHQAVLFRGQPAPLQHPDVSPYVCHQPAQTSPEAAGYVCPSHVRQEAWAHTCWSVLIFCRHQAFWHVLWFARVLKVQKS